MKKIFINLIMVFIILSLFCCSVNTNKTFEEEAKVSNYAGVLKGASVNSVNYVAETMMDTAYGFNDDISDERKIIKNYQINSETTEFDKSIENINALIKKYDGYINSSSMDKGSLNADIKQTKYANYSIKIPADSALKFIDDANLIVHITFKSDYTSDITNTYNDETLRKETLNNELIKLNELVLDAKNVDELIKLEQRISEVTSELQRIERRINRYDNQINYSTVDFSISEVVTLTEVVSPTKETDIAKEIKKNVEITKKFVKDCGIYLLVHIPMIVLGLIVLLIILFIKWLFTPKKKNIKKEIIDKTNKVENHVENKIEEKFDEETEVLVEDKVVDDVIKDDVVATSDYESNENDIKENIDKKNKDLVDDNEKKVEETVNVDEENDKGNVKSKKDSKSIDCKVVTFGYKTTK